MSTDVVVAIIAGCCTIIGVVITSVVTARKTHGDITTELRENQKLMEEKIETLTKTVEKHNRMIERMYKVEEKVTTLEREMSEVRTSIGLKGGKKNG